MSNTKIYYLSNGEFIVTSVAAEIHTILGSCVSVCLRDKITSIAGINHFMVPGAPDIKTGNPNQGYFSTAILVRSMLKRGCLIKNMEAKVFGGANTMVPNDQYAMGTRNIEVANALLLQFGIKILARHTGGRFGRKIIFNTTTGKVKMRLLNKV
ncbi:chemotaxis protein CheD [Fulvivirga ulvae]|uniref:chemotaxis protein CheD n=1 Tax=Fulvivirga ulvae TaxID=2904245 RepID=UPI001F442878|nr:chemotaxis protein CheD [Fulvivirga ulvae]UII31842.1 chemotaxis protein CheD [Fulvivirga ulvae]